MDSPNKCLSGHYYRFRIMWLCLFITVVLLLTALPYGGRQEVAFCDGSICIPEYTYTSCFSGDAGFGRLPFYCVSSSGTSGAIAAAAALTFAFFLYTKREGLDGEVSTTWRWRRASISILGLSMLFVLEATRFNVAETGNSLMVICVLAPVVLPFLLRLSLAETGLFYMRPVTRGFFWFALFFLLPATGFFSLDSGPGFFLLALGGLLTVSSLVLSIHYIINVEHDKSICSKLCGAREGSDFLLGGAEAGY